MEHNRNDGHNPRLQVHIQPNIGLDSDVRHSVVEIRNIILADKAMLTEKTRSSYWMVRGAGFFKLRALFETQSFLLNNISDEIAERVQMLGDFAIYRPDQGKGWLHPAAGRKRIQKEKVNEPDQFHCMALRRGLYRLVCQANGRSRTEGNQQTNTCQYFQR